MEFGVLDVGFEVYATLGRGCRFDLNLPNTACKIRNYRSREDPLQNPDVMSIVELSAIVVEASALRRKLWNGTQIRKTSSSALGKSGLSAFPCLRAWLFGRGMGFFVGMFGVFKAQLASFVTSSPNPHGTAPQWEPCPGKRLCTLRGAP